MGDQSLLHQPWIALIPFIALTAVAGYFLLCLLIINLLLKSFYRLRKTQYTCYNIIHRRCRNKICFYEITNILIIYVFVAFTNKLFNCCMQINFIDAIFNSVSLCQTTAKIFTCWVIYYRRFPSKHCFIYCCWVHSYNKVTLQLSNQLALYSYLWKHRPFPTEDKISFLIWVPSIICVDGWNLTMHCAWGSDAIILHTSHRISFGSWGE